MGLGSADVVTLAEARQAAHKARRQLRDGLDPIEEKHKERAAATAPTFEQCAAAFLDSNESAWSNAKHRQQWHNTFTAHVFPVMGDKPVDTIGIEDVLATLQPIWQSKPEIASRVRGRVERVLDFARARGFRTGENPARWRGHLDAILPARSKVKTVRHFAALPWREIPEFMAALREREGIAARTLEFAILTGARSGEARLMVWDEVDLDTGTWIIPASRMKAHREHRVPLSKRAVELLRDTPRIAGSNLVFPGQRAGKPLSDMTLGAVLKRMGYSVTAHGFRSSFRDWAAETTNFPREVVEEALAHALTNKVEAAYRRGDLLMKRRRLMDAWSDYCEQTPRQKVVEMPA